MQKDELAEKRWLAFPNEIRKKLEENVFCSRCGVTTIIDYTVYSSDFNILLKGRCKECNGEVARLID
ncbi:hypothetical protein QA612_17995 [Evansella sp. AB-P1]|uniref:hypothetical protein n=1 Tax=Evansella sp. AB-P1 TaxID=3037653 RepID=UPI00241EEF55|nr:hypothetical protein [Evansella sp. AB-P1]MDG5789356.1 hypothetical protein [Evansella sp. AB-P1]